MRLARFFRPLSGWFETLRRRFGGTPQQADNRKSTNHRPVRGL